LQLITGVTADWSSTTATLRLWTRTDASAPWTAAGAAWPATIGTSGAAWGRGLHGDAPPAGRDGPVKIEGDGKAPAGAFAIRRAYGYAAAAPSGTQLPYAQLAADTDCVDDPASSHYTQILARGRDADWKSAEHMRRADALYTWVIDIAHNPSATPGGGSCIFFHVWHDARSPTVGCTAMAEPRLAALIAKLAPSAVYVLLPRAEYAALAPAWGLPPP
jgi:L,D-peptidoglycan transpeptidase YkuD (ErfK/YbiS/YcfS/YnhG family)